ncbi:HeH/LEM domain-containing protein [Streptococcus suis]|uniref:HeH/LEM domain-containing protein n=1 Tax=Streptococcus suis TaxID=1307 RepID=UPI000418E341|nr:HeH/LEM domain-containing protein [Streptococcus suis]
MTYKTTKAIRDLQDDDFCYYAGAIYPRPGLVVSQERLDELVEKGAIVAVDEVPTQPDEKETVEVEEVTVEDPTIDEIKAALDDLGIKYSSRAKKAELLELLKGA